MKMGKIHTRLQIKLTITFAELRVYYLPSFHRIFIFYHTCNKHLVFLLHTLDIYTHQGAMI